MHTLERQGYKAEFIGAGHKWNLFIDSKFYGVFKTLRAARFRFNGYWTSRVAT